MNRFSYQLELLDDIVISQRAATSGGHQSLDYLPGQTLLGACAARLYKKLGKDAYTVFHSGKIRFGSALPLINGSPTFPMPLCWHERKTQPAKNADKALQADLIGNFQFMREFPKQQQPAQLRNGYINTAGQHIIPTSHLRMKTALEQGVKRAAESQLFGYQAISKHTRFGGWIEADNDISPELFNSITNALTHSTLLIGRSRSAEYGRVDLEKADFQPPQSRLSGRTLTIWLLSDLAVADPQGQATLDPRPEYLGLPKGHIDWSRSFIRSRSYSPWNGYRNAPDLERHVIVQGSVVTYQFDDETESSVLEHCAFGLGLYREAGLGRVWANPELLNTPNPSFTATTPSPTPRPVAKPTDAPLIDWLEAQTGTSSRRERIEASAKTLFNQYIEVRNRAATDKGIDPRNGFGPSASQWGSVLDIARNTSNPESLLRDLFHDFNNKKSGAIIKPHAEGWKETSWDPEQRNTTPLAFWLKKQLETYDKPTDLPRLLQRLAHLCRDEARKTHHLNKEG